MFLVRVQNFQIFRNIFYDSLIEIKLSKFKPITSHIKKWIDDNTHSASGGSFGTQRDSKKNVLKWLDSDWLPPLKRKVKFQIFFLASSQNGSIFDTHNLEQIDSNKNFKKVEEICHHQMKLLGYHPVEDAAVTGIMSDIPQPAAQLESFD